MAAKVADFYEAEVDNAVDALSSLLEPLIMAILGVLVGGLVVAMYLPIFKLGAVVADRSRPPVVRCSPRTPAQPCLRLALVFVLGLAIGSFLNVVIHRLPIMLERQWRAQAAELEGRTLPAESRALQPRARRARAARPARHRSARSHNIPVLSYLALRGRCAACRAPISLALSARRARDGASPSRAVAWHFGFGLDGRPSPCVFTWPT